MTPTSPAGEVLAREQTFFDTEAAGLTDRDLVADETQRRRYQEARIRARNIPKDTLFARMLPLAGKRVLDYGCGTGEDSCHLADCGAEVTAFDLSPESIAVARRRAKVNGLASQIQFDVRTAGQTGYPPASFDVIVGFAILHHLHDQLPTIYAELASLLAPGGTAYFIEPVANSRLIRGARRAVPVAAHATPDERQLRYSDFDAMRTAGFSRITYDHFYCLERLHRLTGGVGRRTLRKVDHYLSRGLPLLKPYFGIVLVAASR